MSPSEIAAAYKKPDYTELLAKMANAARNAVDARAKKEASFRAYNAASAELDVAEVAFEIACAAYKKERWGPFGEVAE